MDYSQFMGNQVPGLLLPYDVPPTKGNIADYGAHSLEETARARGSDYMQYLEYMMQNDPKNAFKKEPITFGGQQMPPSNELFVNQGQGLPLSESAQKVLRQVYEQQLKQQMLQMQMQQQGMQDLPYPGQSQNNGFNL